MSVSSFDQKIEKLQSNVAQLLKAYEAKEAENGQLKNQLDNLQQKIEGLEAKLSDFNNQDKMAKLVNNTSVEKEDSIELKNRLNEYIKEIDKCIAYLS